MEKFKTKIECADSDKEFEFECYDNTEPIEIGDKFLFFFAGIVDVGECTSEAEKEEINPNDRKWGGIGDMVTGFWRNCYKIKSTDYECERS
jgi:hypothetical protein